MVDDAKDNIISFQIFKLHTYVFKDFKNAFNSIFIHFLSNFNSICNHSTRVLFTVVSILTLVQNLALKPTYLLEERKFQHVLSYEARWKKWDSHGIISRNWKNVSWIPGLFCMFMKGVVNLLLSNKVACICLCPSGRHSVTHSKPKFLILANKSKVLMNKSKVVKNYSNGPLHDIFPLLQSGSRFLIISSKLWMMTWVHY